ncbi:MAG TPA: glutamate formimidoyltransferase [Gemmatimonadaceae bacterium]|nr:glutamate formimidoyltransferase [Gemmatimonadaceae bacterium]
MTLVECVPNFSEGRRTEVVQEIRDAIAAVRGVTVLDVSSDESHNRSVITFVVPVENAVDAAFAGIRAARDTIDLNKHQGEHPRMGAADVVPFVPLEGTTMEQCVELARKLGERVGSELEIPVYLYERAATRPERENLANVRRGEFEGIRDEMPTKPERAPDFGPSHVHPTAGAVAIGARPFLVAYNVYLGDASHLGTAKQVARAVRGSSGGLRYVKALGLEVEGQAQVSMNLVDITQTPVHRAFDMVKMEAAASGVATTWSEIVGLIPEQALFDAAARHLQLGSFDPDQVVLERRVRAATAAEQKPSIQDFVASVAANTPTPGGGSVVAHAGALAAALTQMVAGLTVGRKKYADVEDELKEVARRGAELGQRLNDLVALDAQSYAAVSAAYKLPKDTPEQQEKRSAAITAALVGASEVPLETARAAAEVADLAEIAASKGNTNAVSDAGVAALLAEAACRGAAYNVRINVASLDDPEAGRALSEAAAEFVRQASESARRTVGEVEKKL